MQVRLSPTSVGASALQQEGLQGVQILGLLTCVSFSTFVVVLLETRQLGSTGSLGPCLIILQNVSGLRNTSEAEGEQLG